MHAFIGRKRELTLLKRLLEKRSASLITIKGRRRIGKSRLIAEFGKINNLKTTVIAGLPPQAGMTAGHQRDAFAQSLEKQFGLRGLKKDDWADLFWHLADQTKKERQLILLDEISWMAKDDPTFLGKLKNAWDLHFKQNDKLILAVCGSVSSWIEKNIINSTAFFGRTSLQLSLKELPLTDCDLFFNQHRSQISAYEKFKTLSVTGGIPRYLEEINPKIAAEKNILQLCFEKEGILFKEFNNIFSQLFEARSETYQKIVKALIKHPLSTMNEIFHYLKIEKSGTITEYLNDLVESGFISRNYSWDLKTGKASKLSQFRISDNYIRFYLKYILPNQDKINRDAFIEGSINHQLSGWDTIMGLQFENLILNNRLQIIKALGLDPADIINDGPYFQTHTTKTEGVQIDYLIQTKYNHVYIIEIKFSQNKITPTVIKEVKEKITKLKLPKHFSYRTVLICVNGITDTLEDEQYFSNIIHFDELFLLS